MWLGVLVTGMLAAFVASVLLAADARLPLRRTGAVERINDLLPQLQCARCGYPGCRPYAEAILLGAAEINQCAPGGEATIRALSRLLDRRALPLNPAYGAHGPATRAVIDEAACIGCARCLEACPVDAIVGAPRFTHTVLRSECTGCELCIEPCPVDCISLVAVEDERFGPATPPQPQPQSTGA